MPAESGARIPEPFEGIACLRRILGVLTPPGRDGLSDRSTDLDSSFASLCRAGGGDRLRRTPDRPVPPAPHRDAGQERSGRAVQPGHAAPARSAQHPPDLLEIAVNLGDGRLLRRLGDALDRHRLVADPVEAWPMMAERPTAEVYAVARREVEQRLPAPLGSRRRRRPGSPARAGEPRLMPVPGAFRPKTGRTPEPPRRRDRLAHHGRRGYWVARSPASSMLKANLSASARW